jgi:hypothetical protein
MVRNVLIPVWGDKVISEITRRDIVKLVEEINNRLAPIYAFAVFGWTRALGNARPARVVSRARSKNVLPLGPRTSS